MNYCETCKNPIKSRPIRKRVYMGMGVYKMIITGQEEYCPYCIWKGDAGPGAELKTLIKQANL